MNPKFKELAQQAGDDWDHTMPEGKGFLELFAELIVLECMDVVDQEVSGMFGVRVMKKISEHFGVD
jgi:hypothetical protein